MVTGSSRKDRLTSLYGWQRVGAHPRTGGTCSTPAAARVAGVDPQGASAAKKMQGDINGQNVVVIGGYGFIGSHLVQAPLARGD